MSDNQGPVEPLESATASRSALERLLGGNNQPSTPSTEAAYTEPVTPEVAASTTVCPNCSAAGRGQVDLDKKGNCPECEFSKEERLF